MYVCQKSNARVRQGDFPPYKIGSQNNPHKLGLIKEKKVSEVLNNFYFPVVENTTGMAAQTYDYSNCCSIDQNVDKIIHNSESIPVFIKFKERHKEEKFTIILAQKGNIFNLLKSLNSPIGPGYDTLPAKLIRTASPLLTEPLNDIIRSL